VGIVDLSSSAPVVSILTPTFNHERYIRACLESAIGQTDPRWEQIVVDDGSEDGTEAMVRSINDPRIRYIRREHRGIMHLAESYNLALEMSRGTFVAVLEGDDFWPADKIARQLPLFDRPEVVLSWGVALMTSEAGEVVGISPERAVVARMQGMTPGETVGQLLKKNFIPACTVMCRREALIGIGGFQQPPGISTADYPTWLELCRVGTFACTTEDLGFHRSHPLQATQLMLAEINAAMDWGARFVERLPERERRALNVSVAKVHDLERMRHAYVDFGVGRAALRVDQARLARASFRRAMRNGSVTTRLKASVALGCAYLGIDFERVAALGSRVRGR
jgi:glycosyltransferase involved in cell wall biosynthesis